MRKQQNQNQNQSNFFFYTGITLLSVAVTSLGIYGYRKYLDYYQEEVLDIVMGEVQEVQVKIEDKYSEEERDMPPLEEETLSSDYD